MEPSNNDELIPNPYEHFKDALNDNSYTTLTLEGNDNTVSLQLDEYYKNPYGTFQSAIESAQLNSKTKRTTLGVASVPDNSNNIDNKYENTLKDKENGSRITKSDDNNDNTGRMETLEAENKLKRYKEKDAWMQNQRKLEELTRIFENIPDGRKDDFLKLAQEFAEKAQHQPEKSFPKNKAEMKRLGIETYPEYKARMQSENKALATDGKECVRQNWGEYLKAFNPKLDRDYMSQADLLHLDPQLLGRLKKLYRAEKLNTFLPKLELLNKQIALTMTDEEKKAAYNNHYLANKHLDVA